MFPAFGLSHCIAPAKVAMASEGTGRESELSDCGQQISVVCWFTLTESLLCARLSNTVDGTCSYGA